MLSNIYGAEMSNPLSKYFRQPAIYMELPSNGRWWRPGSLQLDPTRKVAIAPMTARDEILLRTPDALLNGVSLVEIFQSCCSAIKDAWAIPSVDIDALLIGIRIASFGNILDVETICPHCQNKNKHGIDLGERLSAIRCPNFDATLRIEDLIIKFQPVSYFARNRDNLAQYKEQRLAKSIEESDLSDSEKKEQLDEQTKRLLDNSITTLVNQTDFIQLEDGTKVIEFDLLKEYYNNINGEIFRRIQQHLIEIYSSITVPDLNLKCESCAGTYQTPLEFDYSNFFGQGF